MDSKQIRADLAPDPLSDPRVKALVDAARDVLRHMPDYADTAWIYFAAALAAFDAGGKADD